MTNQLKDYYFTDKPAKSGRYSVLFTRAKSRNTTIGSATFRKRASGGHPKGWSELRNGYGRSALPSYDSRDNRIYTPTVVCWTHG